ncbi:MULTISPECIES: nuclear transport factor 2 family protein [unclassified Streptomyces]|uniref:nuclear transport factor 2 family protein n=1 Tax=unclassified Streptomyces TaxID=2593676 RepID=UPI0034155B74
MTAEALDPLDRLLAERACERIVVEFVHMLDLGDPGDVADLFTDAGVWEWAEGDRRIEGREALRSYFAGRPADRLSRRICTNILVTVTSESTATATTYFTTYRVDGHTGGFVPPRAPTQVGHYEDTFRKVEDRWLLDSRSLYLAFAGPTERLEAAVEN